jgi:triosephosphate isomerase
LESKEENMGNMQSPFLIVNPKSYLYGNESLKLAKAADQAAKDTGLPIIFTCPYADVRMIRENTENIIVCVQSMDPLTPGRGMGHVLPESLKEAGADAVFLNHAENPKTLSDLYACIRRAAELDMTSIVCADSITEAKAVACMNPDVVLAEPTDLIGTGQVADDAYTMEAIDQVRKVNPDVLVVVASGVSTAEDCYNMIRLGADGTGGTSGILNAPSPAVRIREMAEAIVRAVKASD